MGNDHLCKDGETSAQSMRTRPKTLFQALMVPSLECATNRMFVKLQNSCVKSR